MKKLQLILITLLFFISVPGLSLEIYAHRGGRGLTPENTLPSYRSGIGIGVDYVDMDVNMTKDGVVVVTHNFALNPDLTKDANGNWISTDKKIFIKDLTLKQLETYTVGELKPGTKYASMFPLQRAYPNVHIPTLRKVIEYVKNAAGNNVGFQIEIKTNPPHPNWTFTPQRLAKAVVKIIDDENIADRTELQAFDWRVLQDVQKLNPKIVTAYLTDGIDTRKMASSNPKIAGLWTAGFLLKNYNDSIPKMIATLGGKVWGPQDVQLTPELVDQAHELGLKVVPWSWPEKTGAGVHVVMKERLIDMGVDGMIVDRPDVLRGLLTARGMRVPPGYDLVSKRRVREPNQ